MYSWNHFGFSAFLPIGCACGESTLKSSEAVLDVTAPSHYGRLHADKGGLLETFPTAAFLCSADGRIQRFNRRAAQLWGRPPEPDEPYAASHGALLLSRFDTLQPHDPTAIEAALQSGEPQHDREVVIERPDGSRLVALANVEPLRDRAGRVEGVLATLQDITQRKRLEDMHRDTEKRFRTIFDALPTAIYMTDAEGSITFYNRAAVELAGREPELGKDKWCVSWRLRHTDGSLLPHDECPMAQALKQKRPIRGVEAFAERPDGTLIPFIPYPTPLFSPSGEMTGAVNMLVDISERKLAEAALRAKTERLDALNGIARSLSRDLDLERIVQAVTDNATQLAGAKFGAFFYNVTDAEGERFDLFTMSGAPREAFERFGMPRRTAVFAPTFDGEGIVRSDDIRKDPRYGQSDPHHGMPEGHLPVVSYLAVPVVSRSGKVHGGLFFGHDQPGMFGAEAEETVAAIAAHAALALDNANLLQDARREMENRRRADDVARRLASIVESSEDAIVSKSLDGIIQTWNRGAERLFGYSAAEAVGQSILMLIPGELRDEEPRIISRIREGERVDHFETKRRRKDGSLVDISLTVSPVRDADGQVIGASKIARDVGERKRSEEVLRRRVTEQSALYQLTKRLHRARTLREVCDASIEAISKALGCSRASILLFDQNGVMRFVAWRGLSESYRKAVDGHSPWTTESKDPQPIFVADLAMAEMDETLRAVIAGEGIGALGFIPLISGGRVVGKFMTYYDAPHAFDEAEAELALTIARQLGYSIGRIQTEEARARIEAQLRLNEERERARAAELQAIMDSVPAPIWIARNPDCRVITGNRASDQLLRIDPDANSSLSAPEGERPSSFEVYADGRLLTPDELPVQRAARGEEVKGVEEEVRFSDGSSRFLLGNATPLRDANGQPAGAVAAFLDITERKEAEFQRDLLVAELSHRVKNTLATVISIARQSFATNPDPHEAQRSFNARIRAMGQTHGRLAESNWAGVQLATLLNDELAPYRHENGANIEVTGPPVRLDPKQALTLGMAMHELATNAAKYGALSTHAGVVRVGWELDRPTGELIIRWSESGGPAVPAPNRNGFGRLLIEKVLVADLNGEVRMDFAGQGLTCVIKVPLRSAPGEN